MTDNNTNIYTALLALQRDLPVIPKNREANTGKFSYSFADIADVTAELFPRLTELDVIFTCSHRVDGDRQTLTGCLYHVPSNTHVQGEIDMKNARTAQEIGSATTYYRRYLLASLTGVITDSDEDGTIASKVQNSAITQELDAATTADEVTQVVKRRKIVQGTEAHQHAVARYNMLKRQEESVNALKNEAR